MTVSIFLSHNSADKAFVRRLAGDLENQGISCWLDEAEIRVGESLIEKIRSGLDGSDYVAAVLSPSSVGSPWVQRELDVAMNQEIRGKAVKVLPIIYQPCDLPGFLLGKKYADFSDQGHYSSALEDLVRSMGVVFNRNALSGAPPASGLDAATNAAIFSGLPLLAKPFYRPHQYIGLRVSDAAKEVEGSPNEVGNIIVESSECRMLLEAEGNFVSYIDAALKRTAPHYQNQQFDPEPILGAFSISPHELELVRSVTHSHTFYDHKKRLNIGVICLYDGGPISIGISSKYYGN